MVTDDCHGEHVNDTVNIDASLYVNIDVRGAHCECELHNAYCCEV